MQQNSRCRLCGDRDEMINHIINKYSKLAKKEYKSTHDWEGKVIHFELCKKLKFYHTTKWYKHKIKSVSETETYKILWDFEIQTDHRITARRSDLEIVNKIKNLSNSRLCRPNRQTSQWKSRKAKRETSIWTLLGN